ncbi:RNA recognition motif-containing protein [Toxoplasma gondii GAB2-2007-GAL-DOM2]|uniref:RNA recognition motif-containing protein n=10 Tax=Toxoplasma gondii TaxID=5811 RepID=A0A125YXD4_TOXGV|nr:RNA recognition motif-containing protein [Toxoplasma gondii GT1]ESS29628.1 RNA recognition motif-containing protein [Toxoplasma gondii VEG]KFG30601.1 RNA recognition motif-containing protein [Toxoplasma gondii GAB2-2007-GAL-DOM2]KFG38479.1 RNA recognition motif-containing protein [Toxoplasma gondii FOU]PIL97573.1 RNA recognition motif-containing protein [Toxoplasma gondii COUG]PUA84625.1 RNA recognition motif-containing protein [Toxoplasma gondii TgCATBr9]
MPRAAMDDQEGRKVYIGGIEADTTTEELESIFGKYGTISTVWVARNPPGFAFLTFDDYRDAKDAVAELDGYRYRGKPIRVEIARGPGDKRPRRRFGDDDRRDGRGREEWGWRGREDERRGRDDYDRRRRDDDDRGDREGRYRNSDGDYRSREEDYGRRRERSRSRSDDRSRRYEDDDDDSRRDRRRDYY